MPGPGPHTAYALGAGVGMMRLSRGRFSPQHCLFYAANAFLGPDLGSFAEWLASTLAPRFLGAWPGALATLAMEFVHHPFYYPLLLGFPLSAFYAWLSAALLRRGLLDTASGVPLSRRQCFLLVSAGSLTHFFLDHLFEENGHSRTYSWILSTGWWNGRAPINFDATIVVGLLCTSLIGGFIYINSDDYYCGIPLESDHAQCDGLNGEVCEIYYHKSNPIRGPYCVHNVPLLFVVLESDILAKSSSACCW